MARALYIHWPFCAKKCPYCDFNSHVRDQVDIDAWRAALLSDMRFEHELAGGEPLESIFLGGGTPSLMPPHLVADLLKEADALWGFAPNIEITLEANPSSVEANKFQDLASAGINRVSLGVQSLHDETLQWLGRLHGAEEALNALGTAQKHFERVSFDLIYALPDQTPAEWEIDLRRALGFGTSHLSLYQLTIEPGTRFASDYRRGKLKPLNDDKAAELFVLTQELTRLAGRPAYETSNHAAMGEESRHNLTYWRYQDYCGIGPGAHGRRAQSATTRHKKPENYLKAVSESGNGLQEDRRLGIREQASEALLMGLRLVEGIDLRKLSQRFSLDHHHLIDEPSFERMCTLDLMWRDDARIGVTQAGRPLLDALLGEVVSDHLLRDELVL